MLPNSSSTHTNCDAPHDPYQIPSIRLISATPSAVGLASDANNSFTNSAEGSWASAVPSAIAPKGDGTSRKRLVPKKSKLGLLSVGSKDKIREFAEVSRRDSASVREGFDIFIDHPNDPELEDIVVVKKQKSRGALNGLKWGALGEVTNVPNSTRSGSISSTVSKLKEEEKKWWSIGRGRKDSKEKNTREPEKCPGSPSMRSKTPELFGSRSDSRTRFNSLDSRALLSTPMKMGFSYSKASTAFDPERTPRPSHVQRSVTPESLRAACRSPSPQPPRSTTPASTLNNLFAPSNSSSNGNKEQGSIALRAIRSVKSLARMGGWSQLGVNENGVKASAVKEKKEKKEKGVKEKKKERSKDKENLDGALREKRGKKDKEERKERKERKKKEKKEKETEATLRHSSSSFEAGPLAVSPERVNTAQTLGRKKVSILGLGLPSSIRLPSTRNGSTASSVSLQPNRPLGEGLGSQAKERMGSTISTASSLRPISMASSSGASASTRESRGSVKWDEEGLQSGKREIQKDKKEKRKKKREKEREEGGDSKRLNDGKRRISITDVFPEVQMGDDAMDVDQREEIHKRYSTAFPIVTIEEASADSHDDASENINDSLVYGGILKENEKKHSPQTTPVKRLRQRPLSEQLLGKVRPRAVCEDEEGVLSILDAATNDLAQLINNLDLEATPNTPDLTPLQPDFLNRLNAFNGSPVKKARLGVDSPLKNKSPSTSTGDARGLNPCPSVASITSLRPYAQSRGKATKTLTTPVYTSSSVDDATFRKRSTDAEIGQPIKPWPVLLQQISPVKDRVVVKGSNKENAPPVDSPSKTGTWKKGHKRSMTPGPEPEPAPVFQPLRPPKARTIRISDAINGQATLKPSASSIFTSLVDPSKNKGLKGSNSPTPSLGRRASAFLRKKCSLLPVPADLSSSNASFSDSGSNSNIASSGSDTSSASGPAEKRRKKMPGTVGGSDVSCFALLELDASDPDSDIPDELQDILKANNRTDQDDDTFDFSKRFIRDDSDSADIERPRSILPPLEFSDLPSEILNAPIFSSSLSSEIAMLGDIEEGDRADAEYDAEGDTKKSFDFTGELQRLNESGASNRHSFVEQLENAFMSTATLDLRSDFGGLLQVEAPPVPRIPSDLDVARRSSRRVSLDFAQSDDDKPVEKSVTVEYSSLADRSGLTGPSFESEPESFDIYEVLRLVNVRDLAAFGLMPPENTLQSRGNSFSNSHDLHQLKRRIEATSVFDYSHELDSAEMTGRIVVSADPTEEIKASVSPRDEVRSSNGELNTGFKFGGLPREEAVRPLKEDPPLTLTDIIPPLSHNRSTSTASSEIALEDDSLFKSLLGKAPDPPQPRSRASSGASSQFFQARNSFYRQSQASSVSSFVGFDSFEEVRRGFEFNSQRPGFYPPPSSSNQRSQQIRESMMSIASVSSYGRVINPGVADPFDFGLSGLRERPISENLETMSFTLDDTFSFLKHPSRRRRRVDSDASSFYFHAPASRPRDRRRESAIFVTSQAPPVSLFNRSFGAHRRSDSNGGMVSRPAKRYSHRFNGSTDSIVSDFSAMRLGRPGLGEKMFDNGDQAISLAAISASPTDTSPESLSAQFLHPTYDSIMDDDKRMSLDVTDSIFDKTGHRASVVSEVSLFGQEDDACVQPGHLPSYQFRPLSYVSAASVHSPVKDDDTMISMLGGGHVRRRSIGSIMAGSPCARVEKRKHATFQDTKAADDGIVSPKKARRKAASLVTVKIVPSLSVLLLFSRALSLPLGRAQVPVPPLRPDTPPLSACDGASISGSSMSSLDLSDIETVLSQSVYSISARQHIRSRARARGQGHRRRYSNVRSSRSTSVYETIQEEITSVESSPSHSTSIDKSGNPTQVFIVDSDAASIYSNPDESTSLWDDERGIAALRRYYALQDEVQSTVTESKRVWLDTPFSIYAVQSFKPPYHPEGMKAMLEHSVQNYGPLPSELRAHRTRSRKDSRPSPYPQSRPSKPNASPDLAQSSYPEKPLPQSTSAFPTFSFSRPVTSSNFSANVATSLSNALENVTNNTFSFGEDMKGTIRPRVPSNTKRAALGSSKRNVISVQADTTGTHEKSNASTATASTDQKENVTAMGSIITSDTSLRLNRPRPKGRPAPSASTAKPVQRPIRV
ncbi:hypothetical protein NP233_g2552 [Leucocoprinus birnbaumii]|uniref:Uncharacterized protein n=1 Tax=Leucocoprinus birnbaumii TaxID=56174 RepID=A0AAD5VYS1_9AGAR|nr:hypothetical protein NP233_g2552 [Leucocoprinus birnbaumii]